jgi:hypothetical protein
MRQGHAPRKRGKFADEWHTRRSVLLCRVEGSPSGVRVRVTGGVRLSAHVLAGLAGDEVLMGRIDLAAQLDRFLFSILVYFQIHFRFKFPNSQMSIIFLMKI